MSGRIYDPIMKYDLIICKKCGSHMYSSHENNFYGAYCKNKNCDGRTFDALYCSKGYLRKQKLKRILYK